MPNLHKLRRLEQALLYIVFVLDELCDCEIGRYSSRPNSNVCQPYKNCEAGTYVAINGTNSRDRVCVPCPLGTSTTTRNAAHCLRFECKLGHYLDAPMNICKPCPHGKYSDVQSQRYCLPWTDCAPGTVVYKSGTSTTDTVCRLCDDCPSQTACEPGSIYMGSLKKCEPCPQGTFSYETKCMKYRTCNLDEYISMKGTQSSDRVCQRCPISGDISLEEKTVGVSSCKKMPPVLLKPTVQLHFYIAFICSILLWRCSVVLNKPANGEEPTNRKSNFKKLKDGSIENVSQPKTLRERAKAALSRNRKKEKAMQKIPEQPTLPPPKFKGLIPSLLNGQESEVRDNDFKLNQRSNKSRRLISL